jgi:hypothetical protein
VRRLVLIAFLLAACGGKKDKEHVGVKKWKVTTTTLKDTREPAPEGRCLPADLIDGRKGTWCTGLVGINIRGLSAKIDLYFDGDQPDSKLVELQLIVGACKEETLSAWLTTEFGDWKTRPDNQARWENPNLLMAAFLPLADDKYTCIVRMFPTTERALFDQAGS